MLNSNSGIVSPGYETARTDPSLSMAHKGISSSKAFPTVSRRSAHILVEGKCFGLTMDRGMVWYRYVSEYVSLNHVDGQKRRD